MVVILQGEDQVNLFRAVALKHGLSLYLKTGMKPNSNWTLKNMLTTITLYTGEVYNVSKKAGHKALADLNKLLREEITDDTTH